MLVMSSADQFLQLLEEKDLVSAAVLQAARREIEGASPPRDAVHLSLWLVQGQHITASQAERLLAGRGRVLLRYSGTETLLRVMVEGADAAAAPRRTDPRARLPGSRGGYPARSGGA